MGPLVRIDGKHVVADIWLEEAITMAKAVDCGKAALEVSGMNIVGEVVHDFGAEAFTAVWLLSESHFSIHYFPERGFMAVDCYTCGNEGNPVMAISEFSTGVGARKANIKLIGRGVD